MKVIFSCYDTHPMNSSTRGIFCNASQNQALGIDFANISVRNHRSNLVVPTGDRPQNNVVVPATGGNNLAAKLSSCTPTQEASEEKSFNSRIQV